LSTKRKFKKKTQYCGHRTMRKSRVKEKQKPDPPPKKKKPAERRSVDGPLRFLDSFHANENSLGESWNATRKGTSEKTDGRKLNSESKPRTKKRGRAGVEKLYRGRERRLTGTSTALHECRCVNYTIAVRRRWGERKA